MGQTGAAKEVVKATTFCECVDSITEGGSWAFAKSPIKVQSNSKFGERFFETTPTKEDPSVSGDGRKPTQVKQDPCLLDQPSSPSNAACKL